MIRTQTYHVGAKPFFTAIGEEDNRNRRWRQPYPVKIKLMGLDFVFAHRQHHYLATEAEKLDYFAGTLGLNRSYLNLLAGLVLRRVFAMRSSCTGN